MDINLLGAKIYGSGPAKRHEIELVHLQHQGFEEVAFGGDR